jgi:hypothetical protein
VPLDADAAVDVAASVAATGPAATDTSWGDQATRQGRSSKRPLAFAAGGLALLAAVLGTMLMSAPRGSLPTAPEVRQSAVAMASSAPAPATAQAPVVAPAPEPVVPVEVSSASVPASSASAVPFKAALPQRPTAAAPGSRLAASTHAAVAGTPASPPPVAAPVAPAPVAAPAPAQTPPKAKNPLAIDFK